MGNTPSTPTPPPSGRGGSTPNNPLPSGALASPFPIAAAQRASSLSAPTPPRPPPSPPTPQTPLLMPYAGHLSPQNPHALSHPQAHDYCKPIVCELILDNQLAPFYRGLDDFEAEWTEDEIRKALDETREKDLEDDVDNSFTRRLKEERDAKLSLDSDQKAERARREGMAYLGAVECPICFLNYPPNINTSRCCQQPLCTECFVQIKRSDATVTHLESEVACCPFCVEPDFGVIYERPTPGPGTTPVGETPLAFSPPDGNASGWSQAVSLDEAGASPMNNIPAYLAGGPRRKSVSSKAKEVITIDQIRPDWEDKLNAVKSAAARRAARRIVMRQVGDRLVPIGYTSGRTPAQADFSMSIPQEEGTSGRRSRRTRDRERERELEEMMIMEAMRLSLLEHEEHQRRMNEDTKKKRGASASTDSGGGNASAGPSGTSGIPSGTSAASALAGPSGGSAAGTGTSSPGEPSSRRHSQGGSSYGSWGGRRDAEGHSRAASTASKLLSKITVNRSRANSRSSVHFAPSPTTLGGSTGSPRAGSPAGGVPAASAISGTRSRSSSSPIPKAPTPAPAEHTPSPLAGAPAGPSQRRSLDVPAKSQCMDSTDTGLADDQLTGQPATIVESPMAEMQLGGDRSGADERAVEERDSLISEQVRHNGSARNQDLLSMEDTPPAAPPKDLPMLVPDVLQHSSSAVKDLPNLPTEEPSASDLALAAALASAQWTDTLDLPTSNAGSLNSQPGSGRVSLSGVSAGSEGLSETAKGKAPEQPESSESVASEPSEIAKGKAPAQSEIAKGKAPQALPSAAAFTLPPGRMQHRPPSLGQMPAISVSPPKVVMDTDPTDLARHREHTAGAGFNIGARRSSAGKDPLIASASASTSASASASTSASAPAGEATVIDTSASQSATPTPGSPLVPLQIPENHDPTYLPLESPAGILEPYKPGAMSASRSSFAQSSMYSVDSEYGTSPVVIDRTAGPLADLVDEDD